MDAGPGPSRRGRGAEAGRGPVTTGKVRRLGCLASRVHRGGPKRAASPTQPPAPGRQALPLWPYSAGAGKAGQAAGSLPPGEERGHTRCPVGIRFLKSEPSEPRTRFHCAGCTPARGSACRRTRWGTWQALDPGGGRREARGPSCRAPPGLALTPANHSTHGAEEEDRLTQPRGVGALGSDTAPGPPGGSGA